MIKSNYYQDNPDMQAHFEAFINWHEIIEEYENGFEDSKKYTETGNENLALAPGSFDDAIEYYKNILEGYGDICGNDMSQLAASFDQEGLKFSDGKVTHPDAIVSLFEKFHNAGMHSLAFSRKYGGMGVPNVLKAMASELSYRADSSMTITFGSVALALIMEMYAEEEMNEEWLPRMLQNKYSVTMGLSEPDFGSDLPNIRTKAKLVDGQWQISGTKRFQTMACGVNQHPSVILTLARTGSSGSGARGLSFFLVEGKDIEITGLEKKLGLKGWATCEVAMDNVPGLLIGQEGHGLSRYVIGMLNGARLGVASQGTGLATAAWYEASKYAAQRIQFGKPIAQIPVVARMLDRMQREIAAMRCLTIEAARLVDMYHWRTLRFKNSGNQRAIRSDEQIRKYNKLASTITPMAKYYISETCNSVVYDALQIFGGSGYIEEYDIARLYRDARITNLYDGTTQIQINAAIGGIISGLSSRGALRMYLEESSADISWKPDLNPQFELLQESVSIYKSSDSGDKSAYALEIVETATRLLCTILLQKTTNQLDAEAAIERDQIARKYRVDSQALAQSALVRLKDSLPMG